MLLGIGLLIVFVVGCIVGGVVATNATRQYPG